MKHSIGGAFDLWPQPRRPNFRPRAYSIGYGRSDVLVVERPIGTARFGKHVCLIGRAGASTQLAEYRHIARHYSMSSVDANPMMVLRNANLPEITVERSARHICQKMSFTYESFLMLSCAMTYFAFCMTLALTAMLFSYGLDTDGVPSHPFATCSLAAVSIGFT